MADAGSQGWTVSAPVSYRAPLLERLSVRFERARRWEFWPAWLFYPPIVAYILWLGLRYRSPLAFTATNPALDASGFVGEKKADCLLPLVAQAPELVAPTLLLGAAADPTRVEAAQGFVAAQGGYPIVLKPDIGQRGRGVAIIRNEAALRDYLAHAPGEVIAQRYIEGAEFGVFVYREPETGTPRILSITHKCFPEVVGDGRQTLRELIREHERARLIAPLLWQRFAGRMDWVPAPQERVPLVEIGAHCRGSLFLDASDLATPALLRALQPMFDALPGYHFGRLDLRCPSPEALARGEALRILEVNGVSAEAAHIYHPGTPLRHGYASMFHQWRLAFAIGAANARNGAHVLRLPEFFARVRDDRRRGQQWF